MKQALLTPYSHIHYCAATQAAMSVTAASKRQQPSSSGPPPSRPPVGSSVASRPTSAMQQREAARKQYEDPNNSIRGTAERRRQLLEQQQPPPPAGRGTVINNANPMVAPEECPQCLARFATVAALCAHVDEWHPTAAGEPGMRGATVAETTTLASWNNPFTRALGWGDGGGRPAADDVYRCHHCRAVFSDPVALLSHNETSCTSSGLTRDVPRASQRGHSNTRDCVIC